MIMNIIYMSLEAPSMHSIAHFHVQNSELTTWFMIKPFLRSFYSIVKLKNPWHTNRTKSMNTIMQ